METFKPPVRPSPGTGNKPEIKLLEADFGDGYTQGAPDGLNHIRRVLSLTWEMLLPAQMNEIVDFFTRHGGHTPFLYTPSNEGEPVKWKCKDWSDTRAGDGMKVVATLREDFTI
jgi:phage-related protein